MESPYRLEKNKYNYLLRLYFIFDPLILINYWRKDFALWIYL